MKLKQLLLLVLFFTFCISLNVFAEDLKIEDDVEFSAIAKVFSELTDDDTALEY